MKTLKQILTNLVQIPAVVTIRAKVQADPVLAIASFLVGALVSALLAHI